MIPRSHALGNGACLRSYASLGVRTDSSGSATAGTAFLILPTGIANVGKYQFNPASRSYPGIVTDQTGQNYDTLVFGDVVTPFVH